MHWQNEPVLQTTAVNKIAAVAAVVAKAPAVDEQRQPGSPSGLAAVVFGGLVDSSPHVQCLVLLPEVLLEKIRSVPVASAGVPVLAAAEALAVDEQRRPGHLDCLRRYWVGWWTRLHMFTGRCYCRRCC